MRKYGESKTTRIVMATVTHVTSGLGLRKFQADGFLLTRVYIRLLNGRQHGPKHGSKIPISTRLGHRGSPQHRINPRTRIYLSLEIYLL